MAKNDSFTVAYQMIRNDRIEAASAATTHPHPMVMKSHDSFVSSADISLCKKEASKSVAFKKSVIIYYTR